MARRVEKSLERGVSISRYSSGRIESGPSRSRTEVTSRR